MSKTCKHVIQWLYISCNYRFYPDLALETELLSTFVIVAKEKYLNLI